MRLKTPVAAHRTIQSRQINTNYWNIFW